MEKWAYDREVIELAAALSESDRQKFITLIEQETQNPVVNFGWNIWLGNFGVDRFIVGDIMLGVLKLLTFGGLGIWVIVDCFLIGKRTREKNIEKVRYIFDTLQRREAFRE